MPDPKHQCLESIFATSCWWLCPFIFSSQVLPVASKARKQAGWWSGDDLLKELLSERTGQGSGPPQLLPAFTLVWSPGRSHSLTRGPWCSFDSVQAFPGDKGQHEPQLSHPTHTTASCPGNFRHENSMGFGENYRNDGPRSSFPWLLSCLVIGLMTSVDCAGEEAKTEATACGPRWGR